jgi:DNA polymerase IIIc chi subunit
MSEYVTQADREAAQALCANGWTYAIEAFAAHRRRSVAAAEARISELEAENKRLRQGYGRLLESVFLSQNARKIVLEHYQVPNE